MFPKGAPVFGFIATVFMVVGGLGVAIGFQTQICSLMLIIFLIPTFNLHFYWLKVLPTMVPVVKSAIGDEKAQDYFRSFDRQSFHSHEVGLRDNLVFLAQLFTSWSGDRDLWLGYSNERVGCAALLSSGYGLSVKSLLQTDLD